MSVETRCNQQSQMDWKALRSKCLHNALSGPFYNAPLAHSRHLFLAVNARFRELRTSILYQGGVTCARIVGHILRFLRVPQSAEHTSLAMIGACTAQRASGWLGLPLCDFRDARFSFTTSTISFQFAWGKRASQKYSHGNGLEIGITPVPNSPSSPLCSISHDIAF